MLVMAAKNTAAASALADAFAALSVEADVLARVLDPLWSAAVAAAREKQSEADAAERAALVRAEADALTDLATAPPKPPATIRLH
jgi:hypothetical protein